MNAEWLVLKNLAGVVILVAVLVALFILLQREWVAEDLRRRIMRPVSIRWSPFAPGWFNRLGCRVWGSAFQVRFVDPFGKVHVGCCAVKHWRRIVWIEDRILWAATEDEE